MGHLKNIVEQGWSIAIEPAARAILRTQPAQPFALKALGFALLHEGRIREVLPTLELAVRLYPTDAENHNNLGVAYFAMHRWNEALLCFDAAVRIAPNDAELWKNAGEALFHLHRWTEAVPKFLAAIEKAPDDYVAAIELLAASLMNVGRLEEARVCYEQLLSDPVTESIATYQLIVGALRNCEWHELGGRIERLHGLSDGFRHGVDAPFFALAFPGLSSQDHFHIANAFATRNLGSVESKETITPPLIHQRGEPTKLRIGYLSADFRFHPVGMVLSDLVERHNRDQVEVFGYSIGEDDKSDLRRRLAKGVDTFVDLWNTGVPTVVERIRSDKLDVLVDLTGWTASGRPEALLARCAPIQVNWLGYPGTMGDPRLADYIIGDPIVTPIEHSSCYSEAIAHLPNCYLPYDTKRVVPPKPTHASAALPDGAFVFGSLNNNYKFNPVVADLWANILNAVPDSVLWLTQPRAVAQENLWRSFEERGIRRSRVIFAPRVEHSEDHLARLQCVDLALDTFPYGAHSSGLDALWAGVPMVTLLGETFAGRVGASMLSSANLPEMIAKKSTEYLEIAVELSRSPSRIAAIRQRLGVANSMLPLFDMKQFACDLEALFFRMCESKQSGLAGPLLVE